MSAEEHPGLAIGSHTIVVRLIAGEIRAVLLARSQAERLLSAKEIQLQLALQITEATIRYHVRQIRGV